MVVGQGWESPGWFALRTPFLPFDALATLGAPVDEDSAPGPAQVRARLLELARRPAVREAIFVASPSLEERLSPWLDGRVVEPAGRLERPLLAYLIRMASRSTPFGLFSAMATGCLSERTALSASAELRRHTRPDMDYLASVADRLVADLGARAALTWRPNSSLYAAAGRLRMVETRRQGGVRSHHLVALEPDVALLAVLAAAAHGARLEELAALLVDDEVDVDTATAYLHDLVDAQVLVTDFAPAVTGPEPLPGLIADLQRLAPRSPAAAHASRVLEQAGEELAKLDAAGVGACPSQYRQLAEELATVVPDADVARLFQVDLFRVGPPPTLGAIVVAEAARAVELLARISPPAEDALASFREAFVARYQGAEVPVLEALDEESGVGFDSCGHPAAEESPLLAGLNLATPDEGARWSTRDDVLLRLLARSLRTGAVGIELAEADIAELEAAGPLREPGGGIAPTLSVMGRLAAASSGDVDEGRFRLFVNRAAGASGAQLLGRFCHGDAVVESGVREMLRAEESDRPDAVFAEIVHLPEGRIGNILCRPVLRRHEIAYLGRSGAPASAQISLHDLTVAVVAGRVVLRSRRLGREVVPRLTSAHNTRRAGVAVYRFLAALQHQGETSLSWDWGALRAAPVLPRVSCGRLVLSRAQWSLRRLRRREDLERARREDGLPRRVALRDGDNELLLDLDDPYVVPVALDMVKDRDEVTFVEMFPDAEELCVTGPGGSYLHELIIPLAGRRPPVAGEARSSRRPAAGDSVRRAFAPGSEWLYVKLYTGDGTADSVLRSPVAALVREALQSGAADRWFFVRFADPEHHLRLRLHGDPQRLRAEVEPALAEAGERLMAEGTLWRVAYDTYQREVERYGGAAGIDACEALFSADSDAVLAIVERLSGDAGLEARWQLCVAGIDRLLADAGLALEERRAWARARAAAYFAEVGGGPVLARQLGELWRRHGRGLQALVGSNGASRHPFAAGLSILDARSEANRAHLEAIRGSAQGGELGVTLDDLLASLAHMHANRLLRSAQRAQEMAIYELLARLYTARLARGAG